ncbi:agmatinase [Bacteroidota bacterium]
MKKKVNQESINFAGIEDQYTKLETSEIVLIPVPFDATSTWGKGADKGPEAFLEASKHMEVYDIETDCEVFEKGIFLTKPIQEKVSPEIMVNQVKSEVTKYLNLNKFVTLFGGEHSISIGSIKAFGDKFENLTVLQLDAHTDLRKEYEGTPFNHACAVHEASKKHNLIQVGIRSMDSDEVQYMNKKKVFFAADIYNNNDWIEKAINLMTDKIFITIDLDVFDPSIMPSTGTPEPGGLYWYQVINFLKLVFQTKNVVGFDIVELSPVKNNKAPDFLAAKLYYKLLSYKFCLNK